MKCFRLHPKVILSGRCFKWMGWALARRGLGYLQSSEICVKVKKMLILILYKYRIQSTPVFCHVGQLIGFWSIFTVLS